MRYDFYREDTGEIREFVFPMKTVRRTFRRKGITWRRIHSLPAIVTQTKQAEVEHRGQELPISMSLPIDSREGTLCKRGKHVVRDHGDGTFSTLRGDRIVDSPKARDKHTKLCGYESE